MEPPHERGPSHRHHPTAPTPEPLRHPSTHPPPKNCSSAAILRYPEG